MQKPEKSLFGQTFCVILPIAFIINDLAIFKTIFHLINKYLSTKKIKKKRIFFKKSLAFFQYCSKFIIVMITKL